MKQLVIPTVYKAVDKMSGTYSAMQTKAERFSASLARQERVLKRLTPSFGDLGKQMMNFVAAGGAIAGIGASVNAIMNYEDAVASFRTIVSDLNDNQFAKFQKTMDQVGVKTRKSGAEVFSAAEKIAGLNATFADTADGLAAVTEASITLARAARMETGLAAENLVGIMNQFNMTAKESNRVINVLAAGQAVGGASISETAESFKNFGAVAAGANITLEQSVALIQTLSQKTLLGAEAGTKLRGMIIKLKKAGLGFKSGTFQINDALEEMRTKLANIRGDQAKSAYLIKTFEVENLTAGQILLSNIDIYKKFTQQVTNSNEAQAAAAINSNTVSEKLRQLRDTFFNMFTATDQAKTGLHGFGSVVVWVTDNMDTILKVITAAAGALLLWKTYLIASTVVVGAYNIALGIMGAVTGVVSVSVGRSTLALGAYKIATAAATAATWLFNMAVKASPFGWIIAGITAAIFVVQKLIANWDNVKKAFADGGWLGAIKRIGGILLSAVLQPIKLILQAASYVPGLDWAGKAAMAIESYQSGLEGNDAPAAKPLNKEAAATQAITSTVSTNNAKVDINVNDRTGATETTATGGSFVNLKTSKTTYGQ